MMPFIVFGLVLASFATFLASVIFWVEREPKVSLVAEVASLMFLTSSVWVLYHYGSWTPEWLQLVGAAIYASLAAVWGSGLIGRAKEAFSDSGDVDTGWPPLLPVDAGDDVMTPGMPDPCQPIGCDNGIHLPGCPYAEVDAG